MELSLSCMDELKSDAVLAIKTDPTSCVILAEGEPGPLSQVKVGGSNTMTLFQVAFSTAFAAFFSSF